MHDLGSLNAVVARRDDFVSEETPTVAVPLPRRTSIRQQVGINTNTMKAVRHILGEKGVTIGKAAIMCGAPDWPSSVLCGILRLNRPGETGGQGGP